MTQYESVRLRADDLYIFLTLSLAIRITQILQANLLTLYMTWRGLSNDKSSLTFY
jgi:hypothetical protein